MAPLVNLDADPSLVDEDRGPSIFIVATVFSVLVILSTVTRLAIKLSHRVRFGVDDYLMVIALVRHSRFIDELALCTDVHMLICDARL